MIPTTEFEDDSLLAHGCGITDIAKLPRRYGANVPRAEYLAGAERLLEQIKVQSPRVICFVYKRVLDQILRLKFRHGRKSAYGVNPELDAYFKAMVFVFPMPGTPCTKSEQIQAMEDLECAFR